MMSERVLCASPNWYSSRCSDVNRSGVMGFGAKNTVYLLRVTPHSVSLTGELSGHTERVSGFAFCPHEGLEHLGVSSSDDKTVKIWDTGLKTVLTEHTAHQSTITSVHWSPVDKGLVVSGDEKGIVVCFWYGRNDTHSFFPEPRTIFCLACSPHRENHVAVGYKDGMIVLIDISKKGEVMYRLRGHDEEIHGLAWCPEPGEEHLYTRTEETSANTSNGLTEMEGGGYLASGSRDQTVRIWSTARGKGVMTLKLPFLKKRGAGVDPGVKERLWLTVHWPKRRPTQVVSSCFGGELVAWDLTKSGKQKWTLLGSSTDGQNHSRIVFNLSSVHVGDRELLISTSMDREIKCWDLESLECCWTLPTLGGFVYSMSFSPVGTGCLALGVGDNMIRVWNTLSVHNPFDMKTYWQNIKSKVTALAWHPVKEGCLAFGTDDGKVGVYEVYSNKPPQISSTYHRRTVYSLDWGPPIPPLSFGSGDKPSYSLYSCGGEGIIYQHDPWKLSGEASNVDKLIRDTNNIKHKLSPHTDLSWKPDGKVLAVGNEDGSIEVYGAPSLKLLCSVQQHHKIINTLRWHHQHSDQTELHCLLASGSSNAIIYVHNLRSAIDNPSESPVLLTEAFRTLSGHTNKITSLSWSPHHDARLVTVSYDGTAQIWDVLKEEPLCNYRGHGGRLLCVQWSPVDPDLVWTGGDDFTIHEWAVSKQEHVRPPKSKRRVELEKKKVPQKKTKKKKKAAGKGGVKTEGNESPMGEEERGGSGADEAQSEEEEEDEDRESTVSAVTHSTGSFKEASADRCTAEKVQNGGRSFLTVKKEVKEEKKKDKPELSLKKRKPRSMLPLSTSMDHRPKEELQQDCLTLAAVKHSHDESVKCVPGSGEHIHLGLFTDREALCRMFQEEEESHVEAGHYDSVVYLRLWKGDLTGALHVATEKGELTDHLLCLAPMAGFQVWSKAVEAYVKQLCLQEQFLKAASHLVSIHKIYEAISLLKGHQLYREAIALAKARLQPDDPVLKALYMSWAAVLEKDGHYTTAAKCYLAADSSFDAAKVIAKKGDVMSLKTAANLARLAGECDLSHSLSLRCAKELMLSQDWLAAQDILRTQDTLLGHQLVLCVNELLTQRLSLAASVSWSSASSHAWSKPTEEDFLPAVQRVWQSEFGLATADLSQITTLHQQLRAIESPPATASMPVKQLLSQVALDVAVSVVSQLLGDWGSAVEGLLRAVARGFEVGHFSLMAEMCQLLLPQGLDSIALCKQRLVEDDERSLFASQSLEAFVCYRHLYTEWWRLSCSSTTAASSIQQTNGHQTLVENGGDTSHGRENGSLSEAHGVQAMLRSDGFWKVLLSEPHANLQATQRAIRDVQGRVANLVEQHSRQQVPPPSLGTQPQTPSTEPDSSDVPVDLDNKQRPSVSDTMSLTALAAQTTELQKKLAALPDPLKKYSFPDVVECCIILLYLEKYSGMIPRHLCETAMGLLLKYGTTGSLHKAWQRFTL